MSATDRLSPAIQPNLIKNADSATSTKLSATDYMQLAIALAKKSINPAPNPRVGCVIVKNGKIVGAGFHSAAGQPHAELEALRKAGGEAKNATLFVNLEPCNHHGKTPPCSEVIVKAGIKKVVLGMRDPSKIARGGMHFLQKKGVKVKVGSCSASARELNQIWLKNIHRQLPYLTLKLALDRQGSTIPALGKRWITGTAARRAVMHLRRKHDAILVGINTIFQDDPRLTVRGLKLSKPPIRIILNPNNRALRHSKIWRQTGENLNITRKEFPDFDLTKILKKLYQRGITSILIEGGAITAQHFLNKGLIDRIEIFQNGGSKKPPKILGQKFLLKYQRSFGQDKLFTGLLKKY